MSFMMKQTDFMRICYGLSKYMHAHQKRIFFVRDWFPQFSGVMFLIIPYLSRNIRPQPIRKYGDTEALRYTSFGLCMSSLLFWNYVMHSTQRKLQYHVVCALDYIMISTTAVISTFPNVLNNVHHTNKTFVFFLLDIVRYYVSYGTLDNYNTHQMMCYLSTFIGWYRSCLTLKWEPTILRVYSTTVCTLIFHLWITRRTTLSSYRNLSWYIPWLWHTHAAICQQTSIELSYHTQKQIDDP